MSNTWEEPAFNLSVLPWVLFRKALLLIRMQSWADYHNELDGFAPDWFNREQVKYGIKMSGGYKAMAEISDENSFLFQIAVGSRDRAGEMWRYFIKDIEELVNLKAI